MRFLLSFVALASITAAAVHSVEKNESELWALDHLDRKTKCINGPTTRACWSDGFSINTDFDKNHPTTGKTVSYHFTITNGTCNPDGNGERLCLLVDGQYPGPPIIANWGDTVSVTFTNQMQDNGTSIHFHGLRQLNSCGADGVPGITQCPIAPGQTYEYRFRATQFGTSWYHSHWSSQYGDGILGPMVFHGPAAANYDIDLGAYPVTDWYYQTAFELALIARENSQNRRGPPNPSTILINGTNKDASGNGKYSHVTLTPGKKHLLRIVNTSLVAWIRVSLDNHLLQVIAADFVPVRPFYAQTLLLGIGQRYDVVIDANETAGNYWFRAEAAADCIGGNGNLGQAVFTYSDVAVANPSSTAFPKPLQNCTEPTPVPYWDQPVPSQGFNSVLKTLDVGTTRAVQVPGGSLILVWAMNGSMDVQWELPTLSYFYNNDTNYASRSNVYPSLSEGSWNFWLIQTPLRIPHPIHLHGHDFFVLGQGKTTFNASNTILNFHNPPRRDTATLYGFGWLALAWRSDNAGAWVMHCHIAFHVGEGLGVQFTESPSKTILPDRNSFNQTCESWNKYYATAYYKKNDSGL